MNSEDTFLQSKELLISQAANLMEDITPDTHFNIRQKIALACRILFDNGHDAGLAGQITTRGMEPETFLTQRLGLGLDEITASNLLVVNEHLSVLHGAGMPNPANRFHSWVYRARPDVNCIIHTHPAYTAALSMLEVPLQISHMDNCVLYDAVAFVDKWPGIPFGNEEGELISDALKDKSALLLGHHGMLVVGNTVEEACMLALAFERSARMQIVAMSAGSIKPIDRELGLEARAWLSKPKRHAIGFSYQARRSLKDGRNADCV